MGQKVNPISNRLGIVRGWDSNWYGGNDFGESILEDSKIARSASTSALALVTQAFRALSSNVHSRW